MLASSTSVRFRAPVRARVAGPVCARQQKASWAESAGKCAGAAALAAFLMVSSPLDAEAAKSGGRSGGSNFSRARVSQQRAAAPTPPPQVNNYYSAAPPISPFGFSPFGFSPFGFGGFAFGGPSVVVGAPIGGGFLFTMLFATIGLSIVGSIVNSFRNNRNDRDNDGW